MAQPVPVFRLASVDVFRGVTMAAMVIVNTPGDWSQVYSPLLHADWHGWTPTDLIFPFFVFIVGVSIVLSNRSAGSVGVIGRRAALLFAIGLGLALFMGAIALGRGILEHGYSMPSAVGGLGLGVMAGALTLPHNGSEALYTVVGVGILALGHRLNYIAGE